MKPRVLILRMVLGALVLLLVASLFISFRVLRRLPNTVIYFVKSEDTYFVLEPVYRRYNSKLETQLRLALEDLIRGPTPDEASKQLYTSLPPETNVLDLQLEGRTVQVNLSKAFTKENGLANYQGRLNQVLYTLSQSKDIDHVELFVEGQPLKVLGGEGLLVDFPWLRSNRQDLPRW